MKTKTILIALIGLIAVAALIFQSCKKDEEKTNLSPTCTITAPTNGQEIVKGETVVISVQASDSDGSIAEVNFIIDGVELGKASSSPFTYNWTTTNESIGNHSIKTISIDNEGSNSSDQVSVVITQVGGDAPVANFISNITSGPAPLTVNFTDQSANNPTSWDWDFGTGSISNQENPSHIYNNAGTYTVALTTTNENGSDIETKVDYIVVSAGSVAPVANFTSDISEGFVPLTVNFTDHSTNAPTNWEWAFGDGNTSTQQNPSHIYNNAGTYTVALTATNDSGSDNETKVDFILAISGSGNGEPCPGTPTVTDADGNVYNTVQIGAQCWMRENLNIGARIDGSQEMTDNSIIEKYCYNNDPANCDTYGGLYQWNEMMQYTTTTEEQGICPTGWHIPSDDEWIDLSNFLGGAFEAGGKMKETGTLHWASPNTGATNESGFSAIPGGQLSPQAFGYIGVYAKCWSSTLDDNNYYWSSQLASHNATWQRVYGTPDYAYSIRCLKD